MYINPKVCSTLSYKEIVGIAIFTFCFLSFFSYNAIPQETLKLLKFISIPVLFFFVVRTMLKKDFNVLFNIMRCIVFSYIISMFSALFFQNQSLLLSYRVTADFFVILCFFYIYKRNISIEVLEEYVAIMSMLFVLIWLIAWSQAPKVIFGFQDEFFEDLSRGLLRVRVAGVSFAVFAYFIAINKLIILHKIKFLALAVILYAVIFMQLTRQIILFTVVISIGYIFGANKKLALLLSLLFLLLYNSPTLLQSFNSPTVNSMIQLTMMQMDDNSKGEENVRITEYKYYFTEWHTSLLACIIGSGAPHSLSNYGSRDDSLKSKGFFREDIGYGEMYTVIGFCGMFLYIFLFFKGSVFHMPKQLAYVNMFMIYEMLVNIGTNSFAMADNQIVLSICVYLLIAYGGKKRNRAMLYQRFINLGA